jgi:hypothetical protein
VDAAGNAYVAGTTGSSDFPVKSAAFQTTYGGGSCGGYYPCTDAFVTKLNPTGSALLYSTYLGGSGEDGALGIAVDAAGNAYVTGTASADFPTTPGAFQAPRSWGFVTKLNSAGSALVYSTSSIGGTAIALDRAGNTYLTGGAGPNFPTTPGAFQTSPAGSGDAFVTKLNSTGSALVYSTYLGGSKGDSASSIAVDTFGSAYVTGGTASTNFPIAPGAFQTTYSGGGDVVPGNCAKYPYDGEYESCSVAFISKLNPLGSALAYSTYLGGSWEDGGSGIAVDASGYAYVVGLTTSFDFPTTQGAFETQWGTPQWTCQSGATGRCSDAFISKLNAVGSALVYSTYLSGNGAGEADRALSIAVDASGKAYVAGVSREPGEDPFHFPTTAGAIQSFAGAICDAELCDEGFVTELDAPGSAILYSTYLGGSTGGSAAAGIAVHASGNVYVAGSTGAPDFPVTSGALQTAYGGDGRLGGDAFVMKVGIGQPAVSLTSTTLTFAAQAVGTFSTAQSATLKNTGGGTLKISSIGRSGDFYEGNNCPSSLAAGASCTVSVRFSPTSTGPRSGVVTIWDNAPGSPHKLSLSGTGSGAGSITLTLSLASLSFGSVPLGTTSNPQTVTLTNTGTVAASFRDPFGFATTGANWRDFHKNPWRCGTSLAPKASCQVSVFFKPLAKGARTGFFQVRQGAASVQIPLSGTGL